MDELMLKAIGEPKRFLLLQLMAERGYCVRALARKSNLSESAVSQHLKILREAGFLYGEKRGHFTHYKVDRSALQTLADTLHALAAAKEMPSEEPHPTHSCRCRKHSTGGQ